MDENPVPDNPVPTAGGVRARVRAEITSAIKSAARDQLATDGAGALSLRAIARELDMASSAIYRYFASRDHLLTALIIDAYDAVGQVAESADAAIEGDDFRGRFVAIATGVRSWAAANPHEYALIFGSPVPGYEAPDDTIDPATRVPVALLGVLIDAHEVSAGPRSDAAPPGPLVESLVLLSEYVDHRIPAESLASGVRAWAEMLGLISLELFGHFNNTITETDSFYGCAIAATAERLFPHQS